MNGGAPGIPGMGGALPAGDPDCGKGGGGKGGMPLPNGTVYEQSPLSVTIQLAQI